MPKGKIKGKYKHKRTEMAYSSDEDAGIDVTLDNCSEISGQSDLKSNHDDAGTWLQALPSSQPGTSLDADDLRVAEALRLGCRMCSPHKCICGFMEEAVGHALSSSRFPKHALKDINRRPISANDPSLRKPPNPSSSDDETEPDDHNLVRQTNDNEIQEKQEEKLLEIIESLSARSTAARAAAFVALRAALQRRAFDAVLFGHRATLADHLARALRRGKDAERKAAAAVAPLVALQIGDEGTEEFVSEVRPALVATLTDKAASLDARAECCSSLGVLCYVMEDDVTEILEVMRVYETIFSGSYLKGDGSVKVTGAAIEEGVLHAAALDAWALLLAVLEPDHALQLLRTTPPSLQRLAELLEVPALDVRLAAGGALALAHENACSDDGGAEMELAPHVEKLLPRLEELARDSHKYRAKRDRKVQRATFRDILKYFEEGSAPEGSARVGQETAAWRSWGGAAAYGALAAALGGALQPLALRSGRLRAALALPDVMPPDAHALRSHKLTKFERNMNNIAACKARTRARNRNRDKRSAALAM